MPLYCSGQTVLVVIDDDSDMMVMMKIRRKREVEGSVAGFRLG